MKKWIWLALIPSLVFAGAFNMSKDPIYLDVHPDKVIFIADDIEIMQSELTTPGNDFDNFLEDMELIRDSRYIVLLSRPGSAKLQRHLRQSIQKHDIDIGIEPWETGRAFSRKELLQRGASTVPIDIPDDIHAPDSTTADEESYKVEWEGNAIILRCPGSTTTKEESYMLELKEDSITILKNNIVVTRDELKIPGNAFESFVDELEANEGNPYINFRSERGHEVQKDVIGVIYHRAPRMYDNIQRRLEARNYQKPPPTPLEAQTEGKSPVYIECRNNQLFLISREQMSLACNEKYNEIREQVDGDDKEFLKIAAEVIFEVNGYQIDFTYALLGKYVLTPLPDTEGYSFDNPGQETDEMWFGSKLASLDPEKQYICFYVRPDGFDIFRKARKVIWDKRIESSCEPLDKNDPIRISPGGMRI